MDGMNADAPVVAGKIPDNRDVPLADLAANPVVKFSSAI
jgi:hypothetical protein